MKSSKIFALAGVTLLAAATLAACSGSGSSANTEKTFSYIYETDPDNLNYLTTGKAATANITSNVVDGLLENDRYGNFVPSMAEDWSVSKDGLTYTYTIRKDAKWYTSEGEEYATVKAQDFVTGLKYAADKKSDGLYLVQESIKGLDAYVKGEIKDFAEVGIKALDDHTVQYTLNKPESFWNSKTTMGVMAPVNEEFLNSKGDDFAKGTDPSSILYNGPFLLKSIVAKSSVEFEKNPNYWDKDNVHLDKVKLSYWDGQDTNKPTEAFKDGSFTMARLFPTSASYPETEKEYKDNIVYTQQDSSTFLVGINMPPRSSSATSASSSPTWMTPTPWPPPTCAPSRRRRSMTSSTAPGTRPSPGACAWPRSSMTPPSTPDRPSTPAASWACRASRPHHFIRPTGAHGSAAATQNVRPDLEVQVGANGSHMTRDCWGPCGPVVREDRRRRGTGRRFRPQTSGGGLHHLAAAQHGDRTQVCVGDDDVGPQTRPQRPHGWVAEDLRTLDAGGVDGVDQIDSQIGRAHV